MSLTFKLGSLAIRTLAKPLSNAIKRNATQHDNFRAICVGFAQRLHRIDMRLRLGLLQDPVAIDRQIARELKEAEKKKAATSIPTVKNEAETKADEVAKSKERKEVEDHVKAAHKPPRIRPLSENKAIETGANFIAETFLFLVAGGLILAESWRRDRKEKKQDADVAEQIRLAAEERDEMREKMELLQAEIEALMDDKKPFDEVRKKAVESLHKPVNVTIRTRPVDVDDEKTKAAEISATGSLQKIGRDAAEALKPIDAAETPSTTAPASGATRIPSPAAKTTLETQTSPQSQNASASIPTSPSQTSTDGSSPRSSWLPSSWLGNGSPKSDNKS